MEHKNLLTTLRDLHEQKKTGELDEDEDDFLDDIKWRGIIDYDLLESYMEHINEEIRLEALGLIVDSRKSTLHFVQKELDLIVNFLTINLGEKMEYVPIIKRSLKRLKGSLAVFKRNSSQLEKLEKQESSKKQITDRINIFEKVKEEIIPIIDESIQHIINYEKFYMKIRNICLTGLTPGSTHAKKNNSLKILQASEELLSNDFAKLKWSNEQATKLYQCLLLDTYETNKQNIYKIIKNIEPTILKLDNENKIHEIIDVALKLGNSMRPVDSITASYMLKICLLSPCIENVLKNYYKFDNFDSHDDPDYLTLQMIIIVMEKLREPAKLASENIILATSKYSLYGYLTCIKSLLSMCDFNSKKNELWKKTINNIILICTSLNESASKIVNNSSPEGHFPMERKNLDIKKINDITTTVTPQMVLLCTWRTVKEVSLLFGYITSKLPIEGEKNCEIGLLNEEQIVNIGNQLVAMLCETKHRGAFEQAHTGFEQICRRLWKLEQINLYNLPKIWLWHVLLAISGLAPGNEKLCSTRRSAGVPYMVQAAIVSEPSVIKKKDAIVFHTTMKILLDITKIDDEFELWAKSWELISTNKFFLDIQDEHSKPCILTDENSICNVTLTEVKTHALNILRSLFKHTQLGDLTKNYAENGLIAAIKSYDEKTWAERNAATLLYSSLITRIFGVQRTRDHVNLTVHNKMTVKIFFDRYPILLEFMFNELDNFVKLNDRIIKPSIQAILLILSRLYLSIHTDIQEDNDKINKFIKLISSCAKSRVYKTRELAARALVPFLNVNTVELFLLKLFKNISDDKKRLNLNLMHGYILQILEITKTGILTSCELSMENLDLFIIRSSWILENLEVNNNLPACYPLATVYIETLQELLKIRNYLDNQIIFNKFFYRLLNHTSIHEIPVLKNRPGKETYEATAAKFLIKLMEVRSKDEIVLSKLIDAWNGILSYNNCEVQITGWMNIVLAIHQTSSEKLLHCSIDIAIKHLRKSQLIDNELKNVIYEFLHDVFLANEQNLEPYKSWDNFKSLSKAIIIIFQDKMPDESSSLFKLLGKVFGKLIKNKIYMELVETLDDKVFEMFCDNSWTGSASYDCRIAIASIIHDVYFDIRKTKRKLVHGILLNWWTTVLNLLIDDNIEVRKLAAIAISKVEPVNQLKCNSSSLKLFFNKFSKCFYDEESSMFAAYFVWSLNLSDGDYEMDESDVFNKCYNYENFEPLAISDLCGEYLTTLVDRLDINIAFPLDVQNWLARRLNISPMECQDPHTLVKFYYQSLPNLNGKLIDILDPTYNDKLLQILAFEKFGYIGNEKNLKYSLASVEL